MRPPGIKAVERAIMLIEASRYSHEVALYEPGKEPTFSKVTGPPAFHRKCIAEYDEVLVVLRQTLTMLKAANAAKRKRKAESIPDNPSESG